MNLLRNNGESFDECLWRLGTAKESNELSRTWFDISLFLNSEFNLAYDESAYRKRYKKMKQAAAVAEISDIPDVYNSLLIKNTRELEKKRVLLREQQAANRRTVRLEAHEDSFWNELKNSIQKLPEITQPPIIRKSTQHELIAMLSDIHYGLAFSSVYDQYSPKIAEMRVMEYANHLCELGRKEDCSTIHVLLMGDMISGIIHPTIRLENQQNIIEQIVGVSNLVSVFLMVLSKTFVNVRVSSVTGNHSRLSENLAESLRSERLDALISWFCKAKLENIKHITFLDETLDSTVGLVEIMGKTYAFVHGDFDPDLKSAAVKISNLTNKKIDYILAGHMHIAEARIEDVGYIRNGAVVTGGDDYTTKKRLFGPAVQVCSLASENGVDAIYPIKLN